MRIRYSQTTVILLLVLCSTVQAQIDARMFRHPDVSATHITFVYAGDIWVMPKSGGLANRLSSPRGEESFPRFSPDGARIAFTANYDGNGDVYVVPSMGGEPVRVTHHPMGDRVIDWTPDGGSLLFASARESGRQRYNQFYRVEAAGGLPEKLSMSYAEFGSMSPDGNMVAYIDKERDNRTWKRYRGGWAPEITVFDLQSLESRNIASSPANESQPMWHGRTIYFLSDRDESQRYNIWAYDLDNEQVRQITQFSEYDITFPALGPSEIVFQAGGRLYLLDLGSEQYDEISVEVVTDLATLKPYTEDVSGMIRNAWISPTGKRAVFQARGEIFTVPAEHGPVRNLTASSGSAERYPAWSPDGEHLAYWSDRSGEYQLTVRPADGSGEERTLTEYGPGYRYQPYWSPDSKKLAFVDQSMTIRVYDMESNRTAVVDQALFWYQGNLSSFTPSWSSDSRWLAYERDLEHRSSAIFLFDTHSGESHQATSGYYSDFQPAFDPDGDYLYFLTNRSFSPIYSDLQGTWVYPNATQVAVASLRGDVGSPLAPRSDEEEVEEEGGEGEEESEAHVVAIDLAGFEQRVTILPPEAGNYTDLQAVSGKVLYRRMPRTGSGGNQSAVVFWDLEEREEKTVLDDADGFLVSADGKKILAMNNGRFAIVSVSAGQKMDKPLRTSELATVVDPRAEWRQIFNDGWRIMRDYFYDGNMHGVDWSAMRDHYGELLNDTQTRWDVNFVLGELIGELNASHTYRRGGDTESAQRRGVGLLGVNWALESGVYRISEIVDGAPWDTEVRSPLAMPNTNVEEGDYVLAVNGIPLDPSKDPFAAFEGLAGQTVELLVNDAPTADGARRALVNTMRSEARLRHLQWIESNRRRVDEISGGRVGYVYVRSTGVDGQTELVRQFLAQFDKEAMVIDERWNSGGQIPDRFIELLNRPPLAFWAVRDGKDWQHPTTGHYGPKVMLINGWSGSGGDAFPDYFKRAGLGPLIGTRTWGGLIGYTGVPSLVDGGSVIAPTFRMYDPNSDWFPEGYGVEPDINVPEDPTAIARGGEPQLERAVEEVLRLLAEAPSPIPDRPAYENRTARSGRGN